MRKGSLSSFTSEEKYFRALRTEKTKNPDLLQAFV